ncbi:zf-HC2 domain-containing protein [Nonomuraea bangladeshensis]|uniref:anti-sigma factor family protein n=1 Tax=Nonomuraea bangladeshensis TaxID=404385 RepID=UPI0031D98526
MTCEEVRMSLGVRALGALDPEEAQEVDRHLAGCEACAAELLELEDVTSFLGKVSERDVELVASPPRQVLDRLLDDRARRTRRGRMLLLSAASVAALVVGGAVWTAVTGGGPAMTAASAPERAASSAASSSGAADSAATAAEQPVPLADQNSELRATGDPLPSPSAMPTKQKKQAVAGPEFTGENAADGYHATILAWPADDGAELAVRLRGVPAGTPCRVRVVGEGGRRDVTDGWVAGGAGFEERDAFKTTTGLPLADIVRFEVIDERTGKVLVRVKVPGR